MSDAPLQPGGRLRREFQNLLFMVAGVLLAGMGLKGFLQASRFIDGGVTGISMLVSNLGSVPLAFGLVVFNAPFVVIGYRMVGRAFAIRSVIAIGMLAAVVAVLPFPSVTTDKLLTAVFGGACLGAGIGLAIRGGAVLDGTEVAALLVSRNTSLLRVGDVILIINLLIFSAAAVLLGIEPAMYSLLTYVSASRAVDFLLHGIEEYMSVTITSRAAEAIRDTLVEEMKLGVTLFRGQGGRSGGEQLVLQCVLTRLEIGRVKAVVRELDPAAFLVLMPVRDVSGGVLRRRVIH